MAEQASSGSIEQAAIFLMTLGEDQAAEVLKHMDPKEVQALGESMAAVQDVSSEKVKGVMSEFVDCIDTHTGLGMNSDSYIRNVISGALGEDKGSSMIDRIFQSQHTNGLDQLRWMEPKAIHKMIKLEHPQIIALIMSYLDSDCSAELLKIFPENLQGDIMMRIATMESVQPDALDKLDKILEKQFVGHSALATPMGGINTAANILNSVDGPTESLVLEFISDSNTVMGQAIQDSMFVFDDLVDVDERGIQALLREITTESLLMAMKGADEELKEKIYENMSSRAAEMLRDDLEAKGPVKVSEVETAQKEILAAARRMADAGEITLGGSDEMM